jgi:hypothetical protein
MSRGLGRVQHLLLDGLVKLDRLYGREPWPLHAILGEARPRPPRPPPGAAKPHKLRRRPTEIGDRDNPSRAMASLCARGLVQQLENGQFKLTIAGAALYMPATVWAVRVERKGLEWREAAVIRATDTRVTLLFNGLLATVSLTQLFGRAARSSRYPGWAFTDQRHSLVELILQTQWEVMYARSCRAGMRPAEAAIVLGLPETGIYSHDDIQRAFRLQVKSAHPDAGGTDEAFQAATQARSVLLSVLDD